MHAAAHPHTPCAAAREGYAVVYVACVSVVWASLLSILSGFTEHFSLVGQQRRVQADTYDTVIFGLHENQFFNSKTSEIWAYDQSLFVLRLAGMDVFKNI